METKTKAGVAILASADFKRKARARNKEGPSNSKALILKKHVPLYVLYAALFTNSQDMEAT